MNAIQKVVIKKKGIILQLIAIFLSSAGIVLIKPILNKVTDSITIQLWVTAFRLFPGFIVAWIIFFMQRNILYHLQPLKKSNMIIKIIFSSGLGTFIALSFWIVGYTNIDKPPIASIIGQTSVIFIVILSFLFLKEKISRLRIVSIIFALCGVILITIK